MFVFSGVDNADEPVGTDPETSTEGVTVWSALRKKPRGRGGIKKHIDGYCWCMRFIRREALNSLTTIKCHLLPLMSSTLVGQLMRCVQFKKKALAGFVEY